MKKLSKDIVISLIFIVLGVGLIILSKDMVRFVEKDVGPSFMPILLGFLVILFSIIKLILSIKNNSITIKSNKSNISNVSKENILNSGGFLTIFLILLYVLSFGILGFLISTIIYLTTQMYILGKYDKVNKKIYLFISIFITILIYLFFVKVFNLMLPIGILF